MEPAQVDEAMAAMAHEQRGLGTRLQCQRGGERLILSHGDPVRKRKF